MGVSAEVDFDKFPKQGSFLGKRVKICFHYDTNRTIDGIVVRDDSAKPYLTIIKLDDGRYVTATECQYQVLD